MLRILQRFIRTKELAAHTIVVCLTLKFIFSNHAIAVRGGYNFSNGTFSARFCRSHQVWVGLFFATRQRGNRRHVS